MLTYLPETFHRSYKRRGGGNRGKRHRRGTAAVPPGEVSEWANPPAENREIAQRRPVSPGPIPARVQRTSRRTSEWRADTLCAWRDCGSIRERTPRTRIEPPRRHPESAPAGPPDQAVRPLPAHCFGRSSSSIGKPSIRWIRHPSGCPLVYSSAPPTIPQFHRFAETPHGSVSTWRNSATRRVFRHSIHMPGNVFCPAPLTWHSS